MYVANLYEIFDILLLIGLLEETKNDHKCLFTYQVRFFCFRENRDHINSNTKLSVRHTEFNNYVICSSLSSLLGGPSKYAYFNHYYLSCSQYSSYDV